MKMKVLLIVLCLLWIWGCSDRSATLQELNGISESGKNGAGIDLARKTGRAVFGAGEKNAERGKARERLARELQKNEERIAAMAAAEEPFLLSSPDIKGAPETLNCFFNRKIYEKLNGNFIFGYHFDEGFTGADDFAVDRIEAVPQARPYLDRFRKHLREMAARIGLRSDIRSKNRLAMCIVGVVPALQQEPFSYPGLISEVCLANKQTGKGYFMRFGMGKREGLERAMQEFALLILSMMKTGETAVKE